MIDWVGLLGDESRRPANYARPGVHPLAGLLYCGSCVEAARMLVSSGCIGVSGHHLGVIGVDLTRRAGLVIA
jgi:hypothetical protein